jgi:hypothetical protein
MNKGYTYSLGWVAGAVVAVAISAIAYGFLAHTQDEQTARLIRAQTQLTSLQQELGGLASYTDASLAQMRARAEAVRTHFALGRQDDLSWVGRGWSATAEEIDHRPGFDRIPVQIQKIGSVQMADWGSILDAIERWEGRTGTYVRSVAIAAVGGSNDRTFAQVAISVDINTSRNN